jgi:hypothetical protein
MADREGLTQEELDAESGEHLPEREAMSIVDLGDPGTMTAAPVPVEDEFENHAIPVEDRHNPQPPVW